MTRTPDDSDSTDWEMAYYQRLSEDLGRYRDYRWKIPIWTVTFMVALAAAVTRVALPTWMKWAASFGAGLVLLFSWWNLHNCYERYAEHISLQDGIERKHELDKVRNELTEKHAQSGAPKLSHFFWPTWPCMTSAKRNRMWHHKAFRLAWLALTLAATVFATYALWTPTQGTAKPTASRPPDVDHAQEDHSDSSGTESRHYTQEGPEEPGR